MNDEHFYWPTIKSCSKPFQTSPSKESASKSCTTPCLGTTQLAVSTAQDMFTNLLKAEHIIENAKAANQKYKQLRISECKMVSQLLRIQKRTPIKSMGDNKPILRKQLITEEESKLSKKMPMERQSRLDDYRRLPS